MAYKQENPDAAISALSLEKMALKEFDRGPIIVISLINYVIEYRLKLLIAMMLT